MPSFRQAFSPFFLKKLFDPRHVLDCTAQLDYGFADTNCAIRSDGLSGRQNLAPGTNDREIMAVEIMNCQGYKEDGKTVRFVPVGFVDSVTGKLTIEEDKILWPGKTSTPPNR